MKSLLLLAAIVVGLASCEKGDDNGNTAKPGVNVIIVNGCQYILYTSMYSAAIVHAGNCNNPFI